MRRSLQNVLEELPDVTPVSPLGIPILETSEDTSTTTLVTVPEESVTRSESTSPIQFYVDPADLGPGDVVVPSSSSSLRTREVDTQTTTVTPQEQSTQTSSVVRVDIGTQTSVHIEDDTTVVLIPGSRGARLME